MEQSGDAGVGLRNPSRSFADLFCLEVSYANRQKVRLMGDLQKLAFVIRFTERKRTGVAGIGVALDVARDGHTSQELRRMAGSASP
jgi:hypothetical protein